MPITKRDKYSENKYLFHRYKLESISEIDEKSIENPTENKLNEELSTDIDVFYFINHIICPLFISKK